MTPLVEVRWLDTITETGWTPLEKARESQPRACLTAGYLLALDDRRVVIAHSTDDREADYTVIPRGCVLAIHNLKRMRLVGKATRTGRE